MKCSDCGRDINDKTFEGVCAERNGHQARCTCQRVYGGGIYFPAGFLGLAVSRDCAIHTKDSK